MSPYEKLAAILDNGAPLDPDVASELSALGNAASAIYEAEQLALMGRMAGGGVTQTMRERLARAMIRALDNGDAYLDAPMETDPLDAPVSDHNAFNNMVVDGSVNGWAVIDAILAELREPDEAAVEVGREAYRHDYDDDMASAFTAMIDHVREGK